MNKYDDVSNINKCTKVNHNYQVGYDLRAGEYIFRPYNKGIIIIYNNNDYKVKSIVYSKCTENDLRINIRYGEYINCINGILIKRHN